MARIVFMGTPDFAVPSLRTLMTEHEVVGVVTQPDRPAGRGSALRQSPVKQVALAAGLPILQPERLRRAAAQDALRAWPADVFVVAAYGQILPQSVLDMPRYGCINVHASLLPRWRGAAPIQAALHAGDTETGITIMLMDAGLDTGPMLSQRTTPISTADTSQTLHDRLATLGAELLLDTLPAYLGGTLLPQPQDEIRVTFAPPIEKEAGRIDWHQTAEQIDRHVRAFTPWPSAFTSFERATLKILAGQPDQGDAQPGQVIMHDGQVAIGTKSGLYLPAEVQLEGRKRMTIAAFVNGYPHFIGAQLGATD